ncbi:MAG: hypothetical protein IJT32_05555 [Lachnospiraceae bacterium]|nr:hypothetical protein [Lachnospiraceae bacterium]
MKEKLFARYTPGKVILAVIGILFAGSGIAVVGVANLGYDSVGILYDGIRSAAHLTPAQLGVASNITNAALMVLVFLLNRHYINIGTFIYVLPYGFVVDTTGRILRMVVDEQTLPLFARIVIAVFGYVVLYLGVSMFIVADIGLDPFTGIVMVINDKVKKAFQKTKICFDICCIIIGTLLGGKLGVITLVTAFAAGPLIGHFAEELKRFMGKRKE